MKKQVLLATLLAFSTIIFAQINMSIWNKGQQVSYPLEMVDSVTFDTNNLVQLEGIGVFSVGENKQVSFSPGNLQYNPKHKIFRFALSQLDYAEGINAIVSDNLDGWYDQFGWGTGDAPTKTTSDHNEYLTFVDWGTNIIGIAPANTWRTLTKDEWQYLITDRTDAAQLWGVAEVDGVSGIIILPDGWICPVGITFVPGYSGRLITDKFSAHQTFTSEEWKMLESTNAVFLPAGGQRTISGTTEIQIYGYYWSSTPIDVNIKNAYFLNIASSGADIGIYSRFHGYNVRLVKDK